MSCELGERTLEWGLGARPFSLTTCEWPITGRYMYRSEFARHLG